MRSCDAVEVEIVGVIVGYVDATLALAPADHTLGSILYTVHSHGPSDVYHIRLRLFSSVVMTLLSLIGALLVKFSSGFQPTGAVQEGYSDDMVEAGLIGTAALVGIFGLFIVMGEVGAKAARSMLEQKVAAPVRSVAAWVQATACCRKCRRRAATCRCLHPSGNTAHRSCHLLLKH